MSRKYFGTDGIRGGVGKGVITPEFFLKLGWAVGKVLARTDDGKTNGLVLIGKDTRISGYMFESALEAGLIAAGVDVGLLGPMPTPAIAYLTRTFQARAGIVISASHNPYTDNGIKLFSPKGSKLPDDIELAIEDYLDVDMSTAESLGKARRISDAEGRYIEFCKGSLPWGFSLEGMHIAVDCAHGATYRVAPQVFRELGAKISVMAAQPDGLNINLECGSTKPKALQKFVLDCEADIGIAFDGDGDRVLFIDDKGEEVDGDQLLYLIASHKHRHGGGCKGVVGTLMSNFGLELALKHMDVPFARAKVGDRYVLELMSKNDWCLGGESSGHIVCGDSTTTGDGIISALQVLNVICSEQKDLNTLKQNMPLYPQVMINVPRKKSIDLDSDPGVQAAVAEAEAELGATGRVLLRPSGTEPLIRVMIEGQQRDFVERLCQALADKVKQAVA